MPTEGDIVSNGIWFVSYGFGLTPSDMPNWSKLENILTKRRLLELNRQHRTTATRLQLAKEHLRNLISMMPTRHITDIIPVTRNADNSLNFEIPNLNKLFPFQTEYEAYLLCIASGVDSFLLEVNQICNFKIADSEVRKKTIRESLEKYHGCDEIKEYLYNFLNAKWLAYLDGLRNLSAHREVPFPVIGSDLNLYLPAKPAIIKPGSIIKHVEFFPKITELLNEATNSMDLGFCYLKNFV
jgi:hypothetical protein